MKSFAVVGCGRFGSSLAKTLYKLGYDVLAIDIDKDVIQQISKDVTTAVAADIDADVFKKIGVGECDVAIVSIGSDVEASVIATLILKELDVPYVLCKAGNKLQEKILYKIGADKVVTPEIEMGESVAKSLVSKNMLEKVNLGPDYTVADMKVPKKWIGKSIIDLDVRKKYAVNIVAIRKEDGLDTAASASVPLQSDWQLIVLGKSEQIDELSNML